MLFRLLQMAGRPFIFVNILSLHYVGVAPVKHNQVCGMANFSRNLGGSVGISLLDAFVAREQQIRQVNMSAHTPHTSRFL